MDNAFKYLEQNEIETESEYPYKGTGESCEYDASKGVAEVKTFTDVTPNSPTQLTAAVAQQPVSVAIEADRMVF